MSPSDTPQADPSDPSAPSDPSDPGLPATTRERERIGALDAVRGLAVLGIVPANLPAFALPSLADEHAAYVSDAPRELAAFWLQETLVDQKFITTFAFLFGVGLELQAERAERAGRPFEPSYAVRLGLLLAIGLIHALLVWYGDILFHYALIGFAALFLRKLPTWVVGLLAGLCLCVPVALGGAAWLVAHQRHPDLDPPRRLADDLVRARALEGAPLKLDKAFDPAIELRVYGRGTYLEQCLVRSVNWLMLCMAVLILYSWRILGLFLLGVVVQRLGLFRDPDRWRGLLAALLLAGLLLALPGEALRGAVMLGGDHPWPVDMGLEAAHQTCSLLLAGAYLAGLVLLHGRPLGRRLSAPLTWVGRLALSAYLLESAIGTTLFYSWGLGWYGQLSRLQLLGVAAVECLALVLLCRLWLGWFRMGPVEWAWRSLALGAAQPLRRT